MKNPFSKFKKGPVATVTIELGFVKVLVARGPEVLGHQISPVTPRFFREGLGNNREGLGSVIRTAITELGGDTKNVIAAVPGFQNNLWVMGLPPADELDPSVVIPREANRRMGINAETSYLAWHRIPDKLDRRRWIVVSATRRSMGTMVDAIQASGSKLGYMELRSFALARAINEPTAMILGAYAEGCDVVIVRDSAPLAYTGVYWGSDSLDGPTLVNRLAEAASRSVAVHNQNTMEEPFPEDMPVYVFGSPVGREPAIATQLATALGRPAGVPAPPVTHPADTPVQDLMVNIGLALAVA